MDADAKLANAEDAMDHEFDRSANNREDTSDDSGEQPTPPEQTQLEHPPNGPSAAHFREAARLAAARARKAIEKERALEDAPKEPEAAENEPELNEKTFAKAARKRAMHVSGRDSENEASSSEQPKKSDSPTASDAPKKSTKAAVSQIDERLMLGARMLRAFESQIQRLNSAAERAETASAPTTTDPPVMSPTEESEAAKKQDALVQRAEEALARLELQTRKAVDSADSLANSIEIAGAITASQERWAEQISATESSVETRIASVLARTEHALESMEERFRRVMEIERAVMTRIDQAIARLEMEIETPHGSEPTADTPMATNAPLIEVESLERPEEPPQETDIRNDPPASTSTPSDDDSDESLSVGTLSIDPSLLARRRERDQ